MADRKIGIRILPPDQGRCTRTRYTDGSILYIPAGSVYEFDICLQAVEIITDANGNETYYPVALDSCRVGIRPFKTERRTLHVKRHKKGQDTE